MNEQQAVPEAPQQAVGQQEVVTDEAVACVLLNLGTPDAPDASSVRRYLKEFLSDSRVIEVPRIIWWFVLRCFILPFRPRPVAKLYEGVWQADSPIRAYSICLARRVQELLRAQHPNVQVHAAMTYGNPSLSDCMDQILASGSRRVVVLPMFPQYSATTTAAGFDQCARYMMATRDLPEFSMIRDYHLHPDYIAALAEQVRQHRAEHGAADRLMMSFHGIPQEYADRGDPYPQECEATANALAAELGLKEGEWFLTFQSRFGPKAWLQPYTDKTLEAWGAEGVGTVDVICPGFSVDCLETLEEIAVENRENFLHAGGADLRYIPALNDSESQAQLYARLLQQRIGRA